MKLIFKAYKKNEIILTGYYEKKKQSKEKLSKKPCERHQVSCSSTQVSCYSTK